MKYKVGDKVKVRKDLVVSTAYNMDGKSFGYTYVRDMKDIVEKNNFVLTISDCYDSDCYDSDYYFVEEDSNGYVWTDGMFEGLADTDESVKFRAFLEEVADRTNNGYDDEWEKLDNITHCRRDEISKERRTQYINELVEFYNTFEPKPPKKKMTKEKIEEALGYEIEIV